MPSKSPTSPVLCVQTALLLLTLCIPRSETRAAPVPSAGAVTDSLAAKPPLDTQAQIQVLQAKSPLGSEAIPILETLLASDTDLGAVIAQGQIRDTASSSQKAYDLAYRLMRLYEKSGQLDKVQTLGLRIANGEKPFDVDSTDRFSSRNSNGLPEWANATLAIAIQRASSQQQQLALAKALQNSRWVGARAQIERRLHGASAPPIAGAFGWANLPQGVQLLASNQNVLSICHDKWRLFVGYPWGVAIYGLNGRPVTRVAIGTAALSMAVCNGALWAGTANGLARVDLKTFAVSLLHSEQGLRSGENDENLYNFNVGVITVAARGDMIWLGTRRDIRTYNTRTGALRIFSQEELKINSQTQWSRFLFDGDYVWADSTERGCRRYDTRTGLWQAPVSPGSRLNLIGMSGGQLWGNVWVNDQLRNRVARIDRRTLKATWLPLDGAFANELMNEPFVLYGTFRGQPVFDESYSGSGRYRGQLGLDGFYFDPLSGHLKPVPPAKGGQHFFVARQPANLPADTATWLNPAGDFDEQYDTYASIACLPNGVRVIGARSTRTRYQYSAEDWPFDVIQSETADTQGGLTLISPDGKSRSLSDTPRPDCLMGDEVFFALKDQSEVNSNRVWLGTQKGLTLLDSGAQVKNTWTRRDGLISDRVVSGAFLGDKLYLGTAWWYEGGGLAIYDPATSVFTARLAQDGLAADKLADVRVQGQRLQLSYGVQYRPSGNSNYQQYRPNYYDSTSDAFTPSEPPVILTQEEADTTSEQTPSKFQNVSTGNEFPVHSPMPFLGGFVISTTRVGSRTLVCGTRGVMVLEGPKVPFQLASLAAKVTPDSPAFQITEALRRAKPIKTPAELAIALADANPYYRAQALASLLSAGVKLEPYIPLLVKATGAPATRVRATSLGLLISVQNDARITPILQEKLNDPDIGLRGVATVELLKRGIVPSESHLLEVLNGFRLGAYNNFPFGAQSSLGVELDTSSFLPLLAPHATPAIFASLMQNPPNFDSYDYATTVFPALGAALLKHPESAAVLLSAKDENGMGEQRTFVRKVFGYTDKTVLPIIHNELQSSDPLVRANAASACEIIGDPSSIGPLIRALDLRSNVSMMAIVAALGKLKAQEALPYLAPLYIQARLDAVRLSNSGNKPSYKEEPKPSPTSYWKEVTLRDDWLDARPIREAIRAIDPQNALAFGHVLGAVKDVSARYQAILALSDSAPYSNDPDTQSIDVLLLQNLLMDETEAEGVRMSAAVSLLELGDKTQQPTIISWLQSPAEGVQKQILESLKRLNPTQLAFAIPQIQAIANNANASDSLRTLAHDVLVPPPPLTNPFATP